MEFGKISLANLSGADPKLQTLFNKVIETYNCSILCGHRSQEDQDKAVHDGKSKEVWPNSKHNSTPSQAVDVAPYPIDWNDTKRFYHFAGFVKATAIALGINIRWGGDWDGDNDFNDQKFNDLVHFELKPEGVTDEKL